MVLTKVVGIGLVLFGLAMIIFFPYTHQPVAAVTHTGVIIGIVLVAIGLFLMKV